MQRLFLCLSIFLVSLNGFAQKDVTTFLGIPVDGTYDEMREKLISKGFKEDYKGEYFDSNLLWGEFNGFNVFASIVTNNNKVYRVLLIDENAQNANSIKNRFNRLVHQFENNKRYFSLDDYSISEKDDIDYEIMVHHKEYQAHYYQKADTEKIDQIEFTKFLDEEIKSSEEKKKALDDDEIFSKLCTKYLAKATMKKSVWFSIIEKNGKYRIAMYYDNEYNQANGEDL